MATIALATLNAKYPHAAFGLRYLLANMGPLRAQTKLLEFTIHERPLDIAEALLATGATIIGLGVYIWNVEPTRALVELLRCLAPERILVVGGPEVSHEIDDQPWLASVDYVIRGEADLAFAQLCARVLAGQRPLTRILDGGLPDLDALALPYALYDDHDLRARVVYVEASRGCPYRCEFCLSSLDKRVRAFPLPALLEQFEALLARGLRRFKFVDRTFNLDIERSAAILDFFLARVELGLFVHFELVPDRLPEALRERVAAFPDGALQFEIGIQTLDDAVGSRISRRQNVERTFANLAFLREHTGVHLHTDLIIGLPGETVESFAQGLDRLIGAGVQEVQVGLLKRLRGTPIGRHADAFDLRFEPRPPYGVLTTSTIDFATMQRLRRFALVWDQFWNRGHLPKTMRELWRGGSAFWRTLAFCDWLWAEAGRVHSISLINRARFLARYLIEGLGQERDRVHRLVHDDFVDAGRSPPDLEPGARGRSTDRGELPARQRRHLGAGQDRPDRVG